MSTFSPKALQEREKMVEALTRLARLSLQINLETPYAVFYEDSGHVGSLDISVRKNKEEWNITLLEDEIDYEFPEDDEDEDPELFFRRAVEKAEYLASRLEKYIAEFKGGGRPD